MNERSLERADSPQMIHSEVLSHSPRHVALESAFRRLLEISHFLDEDLKNRIDTAIEPSVAVRGVDSTIDRQIDNRTHAVQRT